MMIVKKASQPEVQSSRSSKTVALVRHISALFVSESQRIEPTSNQVQVCALLKHTFVFDGVRGNGVVQRGGIWPFTLLIVRLGENAENK